MTDPDPTTSTPSRRPLLIAAVAGVLLVVGLVLVLTLRDDTDDTDAAATATTERVDDASASGTGTGTDSDPSTAADAPADDAASGGAGADAPPVELTPVTGDGEAELCAAIVDRLGEYRAAVDDALPTQALLTALEEFEAQIDTQSDDQDWGDRIIEQLTNVRREWVTSIGATDSGDDDAAQEHADAATEHLDAAIDDAACPTA